MALFSDSPTLKPPKQTSTMKNTPVGSGCRPVPSKYKIETSAPTNAHTLDRNPPAPLK
jgi:hypothetical protein